MRRARTLREILGGPSIHYSPSSEKVIKTSPTANDTCCLPWLRKLIGPAKTGPFPKKRHRSLPERASKANTLPSSVPPKTKFPAVAITPDQGGVSTRCSHLISPVPGSRAITFPKLSSGANWGRGRKPPTVSSVVGGL